MSQFAVLICTPAPADPMQLTPEHLALLDAYPAQVTALGGEIVTGFALQPSTTAKVVRAGKVLDGPFAEAKEVIAGFFVLEAPSAEVALEIAKLNPATIDGAVEIRPLFVPPAD